MQRQRAEANLDSSTLQLLYDKDLTLRIVTSIVHSWYDSMGLVCPYTMKFKILLQQTVVESDGWDASLPSHIQQKWKSALAKLICLDTFYFPRSCKPLNAVGLPELIGFHDGSDAGHGGCAYLRYKLEDSGDYAASLLIAKNKVGKDKITPRDEMNGLLVLCRLVTASLDGLFELPTSITVAGDSTCTILSVETDKKLKTWMAGKVDEIHRHIQHWKSLGIEVFELYYILG